MKVKELIKVLQGLPEDKKVIIEDDKSICEAHAVAVGDDTVHILWRQKDICNCLACRCEFGPRDVVFNEPCEKCEAYEDEEDEDFEDYEEDEDFVCPYCGAREE